MPSQAAGHDQLIRQLQGIGGAIIGNEIRNRINDQQRRAAPSRPSNPYAAAEPRMARGDVVAIQQALNSMGYNVGAADGVIGGGTRTGILNYQYSIGANPTGYLTSSQMNTLISIGVASAGGAVGGGNTPLAAPQVPGNASGGQLAEISNAPLNVNEIRLLQRALNTLSYNAGAVDGQIGRGTGQAVSRFLTDRGYDPQTTPPRKALELAANAAGLDYLPSPTERAFASAQPKNGEISVFDILPEDLNSADFEAAPTDVAGTRRNGLDAFTRVEMDRFDTKSTAQGVKDLVAMIVAAKPSLLDDTDALRRLYDYEGGTFESVYRVEETLAAFRQEVLARTAPESARLALVYTGNLSVGAFDRNTGKFKIRYDQLSTLPDKFISLREHLFQDYNPVAIELLNLPDISGIDMNLEEAEAFERRLRDEQYNFTETQIFVVINSLSYDQNRDFISADASLAGVVLQEKYDQRRFIHSWQVGNGALAGLITEELRDANDFVDFMGDLKVIQDHVVLEREANWGPLSSALMLGVRPDAMVDDDTAIAVSKTLLLEDEQKLLWRGTPPRENWYVNEFDWRDTADKVRNAFGDAILKRAVSAPFNLVEVRPLDLGRYEIDQGYYPLSYNRDKDLRFSYRGETAAIARANLGNTFLPDTLNIPVEMARQLDGVMRAKGDRRMYLGIFSSVNSIGEPVRSSSRSDALHSLPLSLDVSRIALYADPGLTKLVFDYYGAEGSELQRLQTRQRSVFEVFAIPVAPYESLALSVRDLTGDPDYMAYLVRSADEYQSANELEKEDLFAQLSNQLELMEAPDELWLWGELKLGTYNTETSAFPVASVGVSGRYPELARFDGEFRHEFVNELGSIEMDREQAKDLLSHFPDRTFVFRMRTKPLSATWEADSSDDPKATIAHEAREMYVLLGNERSSDKDKGILAHLQYGTDSIDLPQAGGGEAAAGVQAAGDRPLLTHDLVNAMVYNSHGGTVSDRSLRWMMATQWLADNNRFLSQERSFFQRGANLPTLATMPLLGPRYEEWLATRAAEIPANLQVTVVNTNDVMYLSSSGITVTIEGDLRAQFCNFAKLGYFEDLAGAAGLDDPRKLQDDQNSEMYRNGNARTITRSPALMAMSDSPFTCTSRVGENLEEDFVGDSDGWEPRLQIVFDKLPLPPVTGSHSAMIIDVNVGVEELQLVENGSDLPHAVLRLRFEGAKYHTMEDGQKTLAFETDAESLLAEENQSVGDDLDVVGIKVGMSLEEADAVLRQHFASPVVLTSGTVVTPKTDPFQTAVMYHNEERSERVSLYYEVTDETPSVLAVERVVSAPGWGLPRLAVSQSANQKYGKPEHQDITDYSTTLLWGKNVVVDHGGGQFYPSQCQTSTSQNRVEDWIDAAGATHKVYEYFNWDMARDSGIGRVPDLDYAFQPEVERYKDCGAYLRLYQTEAGLATLLLDIKKYEAAFQEARRKAEAAFSSTQEVEALPEIKL